MAKTACEAAESLSIRQYREKEMVVMGGLEPPTYGL